MNKGSTDTFFFLTFCLEITRRIQEFIRCNIFSSSSRQQCCQTYHLCTMQLSRKGPVAPPFPPSKLLILRSESFQHRSQPAPGNNAPAQLLSKPRLCPLLRFPWKVPVMLALCKGRATAWQAGLLVGSRAPKFAQLPSRPARSAGSSACTKCDLPEAPRLKNLAQSKADLRLWTC